MGVTILNKKIYSFLSVLCLIVMVSPFVAGDEYFDFIFGISIYLPIILGVLGVFFGIIGVKGLLRICMVVANLYVLVFYALAIFAGIYGFQQP